MIIITNLKLYCFVTIIILIFVQNVLTNPVKLVNASVQNQYEKSSPEDHHVDEYKNQQIRSDIRDFLAKREEQMKSVMDPTMDPCVDFYQYACGRWSSVNPIPKDKPQYNHFQILIEQLNLLTKKMLEDYLVVENCIILDEDNADKEVFTYPEINAELKAKKLYTSCMDVDTLQQRGPKPLLDLLESIGGWPMLKPNWNKDSFDWIRFAAQSHRLNVPVLIEYSIIYDVLDMEHYITRVDTPEFGFLNKDDFTTMNSSRIDAYKKFMQTIFELLNIPTEIASVEVEAIVNFEAEIANFATGKLDIDDDEYDLLRLTVSDMLEKYAETGIFRFLITIQNTPIKSDQIIIFPHAIKFFDMIHFISESKPRLVANYIFWKIIEKYIKYLDQRFVDARDHYTQTLMGHEKAAARWKKCLSYVNKGLGTAISSMYVRRYFDEFSKNDVIEIAQELKNAFKEVLEKNTWIDNSTKYLAAQKIDKMQLRIGYPDDILSQDMINKKYESLEIIPGKFFENIVNINRNIVKRDQDKLRSIVNRQEWPIEAALVNAFFQQNRNQIIVPAGILQSPIYDSRLSKTLKYSSIGVFIGHEITHSLDDLGMHFNGLGELESWWENATMDEYYQRAHCLNDQYSNYSINGIYVNGPASEGENIADDGGLKIAYQAYMNWLEKNKDPELLSNETFSSLNLNNKQLFFLSFAQIWCDAIRPEYFASEIKTNEHCPFKFRVIGTLSNSVNFAKEFNCPIGSPMNPEKKCPIW